MGTAMNPQAPHLYRLCRDTTRFFFAECRADEACYATRIIEVVRAEFMVNWCYSLLSPRKQLRG
jgi:hypothetical protein